MGCFHSAPKIVKVEYYDGDGVTTSFWVQNGWLLKSVDGSRPALLTQLDLRGVPPQHHDQLRRMAESAGIGEGEGARRKKKGGVDDFVGTRSEGYAQLKQVVDKDDSFTTSRSQPAMETTRSFPFHAQGGRSVVTPAPTPTNGVKRAGDKRAEEKSSLPLSSSSSSSSESDAAKDQAVVARRSREQSGEKAATAKTASAKTPHQSVAEAAIAKPAPAEVPRRLPEGGGGGGSKEAATGETALAEIPDQPLVEATGGAKESSEIAGAADEAAAPAAMPDQPLVESTAVAKEISEIAGAAEEAAAPAEMPDQPPVEASGGAKEISKVTALAEMPDQPLVESTAVAKEISEVAGAAKEATALAEMPDQPLVEASSGAKKISEVAGAAEEAAAPSEIPDQPPVEAPGGAKEISEVAGVAEEAAASAEMPNQPLVEATGGAEKTLEAAGAAEEAATGAAVAVNEPQQSVEGSAGAVQDADAPATAATAPDDEALLDQWACLAFRAGFHALDKANTGSFCIGDIAEIAGDFGETLSSDELKAMLTAVDLNGDGGVTEEEFSSVLQAAPPTAASQRWLRWAARAASLALSNGSVRDAFLYFDDAAAVSITPEVLNKVGQEIGVSLSEAEQQALIKVADADGNGEVDKDEFDAILRRFTRRRHASQSAAAGSDPMRQWSSLVANVAYSTIFERVGALSFESLKRVADDVGDRVSEAELQDMIASADANGDGSISFDEFVNVLKRAVDASRSAAAERWLRWAARASMLAISNNSVKNAFDYFDDSVVICITPANLGKVASEVGMEFTEAELQAMIAAADADGNGDVDQSEFEAIVQRFADQA